MPFGRRVRRSLARRFPRTRRLYHRVTFRIRHLLGAGARRLRRIGETWRWLASSASQLRSRRAERRLTVAVDVAAFWEPLTGIGWYLYRLLENLADRDDLRIRLYSPTVIWSPDLPEPEVELPTGRALEVVSYRVPEDLLLPAGLTTRILRRLEPLLIAADRNRVLFAPNYFLPRRFLLARGRRVATVHDLGLRTVPWSLRSETLQELTDQLERSVSRAARLITVSSAVRDEMIAYGYARPDLVRVIHHGPGQLSRVTPGRLPEGARPPFGLHVGTLEPRKNILVLLESWRLLRERLPLPPPLVLCGRYGWKTDAIRSRVEAAESEGWVRHLGYVAEEELAALYRAAEVVVFPSLYEGFGLPALEALWAGTPLVCSEIPSLAEVAGDAALYAPADRPDLLADRIAELLGDEDLRRDLIHRGRGRVRRYSWERAARETLEVFRSAAGIASPGDGPGGDHSA